MQTIFFAFLVWSLFYSVASDLVCLIFARLKMRSQAFLGYTGSACVVASLWEIIKIPKQTSLKNNPAGLWELSPPVDMCMYALSTDLFRFGLEGKV